jgi:anti-sigma B factor antagonist
MNVREEQKGAHTILHISGTLALGEATRALQERFEKAAGESGSAMILEMSGLEHLDSTAIGVLVGGLKRFEAQGRRFYLVNPRERVASVFRITHLDSVFRTFPTIEAAVKAADLPGEEATREH